MATLISYMEYHYEECDNRNHNGLSTVIYDDNGLPDPNLGQDVAFLCHKFNSIKEENELLKDFLNDIGMDCNSIVEALKHIKEENDKAIQISKGSTRKC